MWPWSKRNWGQSSYKCSLIECPECVWKHMRLIFILWRKHNIAHIAICQITLLHFLFSISYSVLLLIFFFRDRAGWISIWMPNHLSVCQKAKYCFYRSQLRILNSPVTIVTYKNRLSVLGWVLQWCCSFRLHCSLLICGWVWMSGESQQVCICILYIGQLDMSSILRWGCSTKLSEINLQVRYGHS